MRWFVLRLCADFFFRPDDFTEAIAICDPPLSVESRSHQSPLSRIADQARRAVQKRTRAKLPSPRRSVAHGKTQRGEGLDLEPPVEPSGFRSTAPLLPPDCSSIFLVLPDEPVVAFGAFGDGLFIDPPGFPSTARLVPFGPLVPLGRCLLCVCNSNAGDQSRRRYETRAHLHGVFLCSRDAAQFRGRRGAGLSRSESVKKLNGPYPKSARELCRAASGTNCRSAPVPFTPER